MNDQEGEVNETNTLYFRKPLKAFIFYGIAD
jgi:hypothetical protein